MWENSRFKYSIDDLDSFPYPSHHHIWAYFSHVLFRVFNVVPSQVDIGFQLHRGLHKLSLRAHSMSIRASTKGWCWVGGLLVNTSSQIVWRDTYSGFKATISHYKKSWGGSKRMRYLELRRIVGQTCDVRPRMWWKSLVLTHRHVSTSTNLSDDLQKQRTFPTHQEGFWRIPESWWDRRHNIQGFAMHGDWLMKLVRYKMRPHVRGPYILALGGRWCPRGPSHWPLRGGFLTY